MFIEVWLVAENPTGTFYKYRVDLYLLPPPPHLSADMGGEL